EGADEVDQALGNDLAAVRKLLADPGADGRGEGGAVVDVSLSSRVLERAAREGPGLEEVALERDVECGEIKILHLVLIRAAVLDRVGEGAEEIQANGALRQRRRAEAQAVANACVERFEAQTVAGAGDLFTLRPFE